MIRELIGKGSFANWNSGNVIRNGSYGGSSEATAGRCALWNTERPTRRVDTD